MTPGGFQPAGASLHAHLPVLAAFAPAAPPPRCVMTRRFSKHYTRSEAQALLPQVRLWLKRLVQCRKDLQKHEKRLSARQSLGRDLGGELVNLWVRTLVDIRDTLYEFYQREIQVKDLDRGLIDFPAILNGKEVFLCWEQAEGQIEFWHDLDAGYAGREPLEGFE